MEESTSNESGHFHSVSANFIDCFKANAKNCMSHHKHIILFASVSLSLKRKCLTRINRILKPPIKFLSLEDVSSSNKCNISHFVEFDPIQLLKMFMASVLKPKQEANRQHHKKLCDFIPTCSWMSSLPRFLNV